MMPRSTPPSSPEDAALWWAARRLADPARFAADRTFVGWLEQPGNAEAWERLEAQDVLLAGMASDPDIQAMRQQALRQVQQQPASPRRRLWLAGGALAACLAAVVAVPAVMTPTVVTTVEAPRAGDHVLRFATSHGEHRTVHLADGSRIALNTDTIIEARYSDTLRDIRLLAGQALFQVAKDARRPFRVAAGSQLVTATGTAFDIAVDRDGSVKVLLVEGRVHVDPARREGLARLIPALAREDLEAGQQLIVSGNMAPVIGVGDVERDTAWNRGLVILRDERLSDAIATFNRYSDRPIALADPTLGDLKVSGIFAARASGDFLLALQALHPVTIDSRHEIIMISRRSDQ